MIRRFLDKVYGVKDAKETRALYDQWSESYEAELAENGYVTPSRCAAALAGAMAERDAPLLDFGCGTGLSGAALHAEGFSTIDGMDISAEMLEKARRKGVYRALTQVEAEAPLPVAPGDYRAITAIGVIGAGAAPLAVLDALHAALPSGGLLCFSFNDHTLADPAYEGRVCELVDYGGTRLLFREHGPHLPGLDMKSTVYILEKS